jgi:hypothetical protein
MEIMYKINFLNIYTDISVGPSTKYHQNIFSILT